MTSEADALYSFLGGHISNLLRGDLAAAKRASRNSGSSSWHLTRDGVQIRDGQHYSWKQLQAIVDAGKRGGREQRYHDAYRAYVEQTLRSVPHPAPRGQRDPSYLNDPENQAHWARNSQTIRDLHDAGKAIVTAGLERTAEPLSLF